MLRRNLGWFTLKYLGVHNSITSDGKPDPLLKYNFNFQCVYASITFVSTPVDLKYTAWALTDWTASTNDGKKMIPLLWGWDF